MPVGVIHQELRLADVPPGFGLAITEASMMNFDPDIIGRWLVNGERVTDKKFNDFNVKSKGLFATYYSNPRSLIGGGKAPAGFLDFRIEFDARDQKIRKTGRLHMTTTPYSLSSRPDYAIIMVELEGLKSDAVGVRSVPTLLRPDPFYFHFFVKEDTFGLIVTEEQSLTNWLIEMAVNGIIFGHKQAVSWVTGKII